MKICDTCHKTKEKTEFNKNKTKRDGLNSICRNCSKDRSKVYYRENHVKHLKAVTARKLEQIEKIRDYIFNYLLSRSCIDCQEKDPIVLHFDHRKNKEFDIGNASNLGVSIKKLAKEIKKCDIRCANCHLRKTAKDRNFYKIRRV